MFHVNNRGWVAALLISCSATPLESSRVEPAASASAAPEEADAAEPGELVLQGFVAPPFRSGFIWEHLDVFTNDDGTLVGLFGPDLTIIDVERGDTRAHFPDCVLRAAFVPASKDVVVYRCPEAPVEPERHEQRDPTVKIERWDLDAGTRRDLGSGPFTGLSFSRDGRSLVARGKDEVRVVGLSDGVVRSTLRIDTAAGHKLDRVSIDGDRALVSTDDYKTRTLLAVGRTARSVPSPGLTVSADLSQSANIRDGTLRITSIEGALMAETKLDGSVLGFDPTGSHLAVATTGEGGRTKLQLVTKSGRLGCAFQPTHDNTHLGAEHWSVDGQTLAIELHAPKEGMVFMKTADCSVVYETPKYESYVGAPRFTGALTMARVDASLEDMAKGVTVVVPWKKSYRTLESRKHHVLEGGRSGDVIALGARGLVLDADRLTAALPPDEPIRVGDKTLTAVLENGWRRPSTPSHRVLRRRVARVRGEGGLSTARRQRLEA